MSSAAPTATEFTPIPEITNYFGPRAKLVDRSEISVYEGLDFLFKSNSSMTGKLYDADNRRESYLRTMEVSEHIASVAYEDMASAFSSWCHRMVIEYLHQSDNPNSENKKQLLSLMECETFGSTAMGAGTANFLTGSPVPIITKIREGKLFASGKVRWASNLTGKFLVVTTTCDQESGENSVVCIPGNTRGLHPKDHPKLLGLDQTYSSSIELEDVSVSERDIITKNFDGFMSRILTSFLILQSSFCKGLAARSLHESSQLLAGPKAIFKEEQDNLQKQFDELSKGLREDHTDPSENRSQINRLLQIRLDFALLAQSAVNLEHKLHGGRAYAASSPVARRLREAAFLPIQAPTEVQLRWILSKLK